MPDCFSKSLRFQWYARETISGRLIWYFYKESPFFFLNSILGFNCFYEALKQKCFGAGSQFTLILPKGHCGLKLDTTKDHFYSLGTMHALQPSQEPGYPKNPQKSMLVGLGPHLSWLSLRKPRLRPRRGHWGGAGWESVEQASFPSIPDQNKQPRWGKNGSEHPSGYSAHLSSGGDMICCGAHILYSEAFIQLQEAAYPIKLYSRQKTQPSR